MARRCFPVNRVAKIAGSSPVLIVSDLFGASMLHFGGVEVEWRAYGPVREV